MTTGPYTKQRQRYLVAERDRLRAVNAKLLEALGGGIAMVKNINTIEGNNEDTSFGLNWLKEAESVYREAVEEARK